MKLLIALDYLRGRGRVPVGDQRLLRVMLRSSDDKAATALWKRGGQGAIVRRQAARIGLRDTAPPPAALPGFWGYTALSAADVVAVYRFLLERAPARDRELVLGHLRRSTRCGTDGFDQSFGIPSATKRPWAVKQGWSGFGERPVAPCRPAAEGLFRRVDLGLGRPVLHTTGLVEHERRIVVILTLQPAGAGFGESAARLTAFTRKIEKAAG
ncbi:serine hydrolase [Actinomadura rayongensis]|uniref:Serine hydrolase n=1 Tax=Actinomadura rayongensis TaxID=1429076 RepID=A0A6I4WH64_9ACTN|nr:serine hydrolase [Actinomadura rayongensis]MXQ68200.1 hypothetical protein [Actinomadura rayongensis]